MTGRITTRRILDGHVSLFVFEVNDLDAFPSGVFSGRDRRKSYVWPRKTFVLQSAPEHEGNSDQEVHQVQKVLVIFVGAETSGLDCLFNFIERVEVNLAPIREGPEVDTRIENFSLSTAT